MATLDETVIERIVIRYRTRAPAPHAKDGQLLFMHLCAAHAEIPLDLPMLLIATDEDLLHDVSGIAEHFDTQELIYRNCFWPRYAAECGSQCNHTDH